MPAFTLAPRPVTGPPGRWQFPAAAQARLANGMRVLAHHLPGQHVATMICHLAIPASAEPDGCDGIAAVTAACLGPATAAMAGGAFGREAAAHGISWESAGSITGPLITLRVAAARLPAALDLLRRALTGPGLDPGEVAGQVQLAAARLTQAMADPPARVMRELPAALYGADCRAGRPADGTPATVAALTPDAITRFRDAWVRPATATIVIAGDLTGLDITALAGQALAGWEDPRPAGTAPSWPRPRPGRAVVLVDQPRAVQAQILLAAPVPALGETGWDELQVAAHILGAPVTGLLDAQVREQSGDSYGIRAAVTELAPATGLLKIGGAIGTGAAASSLRDITAIVSAAGSDGFTAGEHAAAIEAITRSFPLDYETPGEVAVVTAALAAAGYPLDYPDLLLGRLAVLRPAEVTAAYRDHVSADQLTVITMGDASVLAGPLQDLAGPPGLQVIQA